MKKHLKNIKKICLILFSLIVFFSVSLTNSIQLTAQSIYGNNPKPDPNDDEKLCNANSGSIKDDKYCVYYREYKANEFTNKPVAADYRNKMLYVIKQQIDKYYDEYKNGRKVKTKWFQAILDILGIGLAFTGTVAGGERVKSVLGATSGSFQAGRNSVNDRFDLLKQQIFINKMDSTRLQEWIEIVKNMEKDIKEFPWDSAKEKLQRYLFRGSFENALDTLVNETGAEVKTAEKNLNVLGEAPKKELDDKFKNFDSFIRPILAKSQDLDTKIAALTAQIAPMPAGLPKDAKQSEKDKLVAEQDNLLKNYQTIALAILGSGDFDTIENKIRTKPGIGPAVIIRFDAFLTNLKNKAVIPAKEYDFFLLLVNGAVGGTELNESFLKILEANKL